ncbi:aminopeptidase P family protein [Leptothermofonsia sp. ETS-13]|uniref:aminopeptidase P family protein n=1 Tax=Leptothermofonsia sp. ETS-13 TaxID=3035696 RepID=UPI003BA1B541
MKTVGRTEPIADTLKARRQRLAELVDFPVILWSGASSPRNFAANHFPFRASSHFLYFAGLPLENAAIRLESGRLELFMDEPAPDTALWHGESPSRQAIAEQIGADNAYPTAYLKSMADGAGTIPVQDAVTRLLQSRFLNRMLSPSTNLSGIDRQLAEAIASLRLSHDAAALAEICEAVSVTVEAHQAGMAATRKAKIESQVRAAIEGVMMAYNATPAYSSIVTVHGEVLHNDQYHHAIQPGDLILVDAGAETQSGWASDVTRTWAATGRFSATQRAIYEVVLAAHDACIAAMQPGVEYRDIHLLAATVIAEGLIDLGILNGQPQDLVDRDAHALFFPHGVGHLLGLDVHDMEDLGDLAGYAAGRVRSDRFGLNYLRLDRPLQPGMVVTIEPGFYQVPAILNDPERRAKYSDAVNWERLSDFSDVRGIRIEDDVLVTETGTEVLTAALPTEIEAIEAMV